MGKNEDDLSIYRPLKFTGGCLEIRLFYVRIASCAVENLPDQLKLRHLRREVGVSLEINGARIPSSDAVSITLRRDRVNKDSSEVTYVSTDSVKISGPSEFEVCEERDDLDLILCGSLEKADAWSNESALDNDSKSGWSIECYAATPITNKSSALLQPRKGGCSPSIEVYIAGCCSGTPVILMKTVLVSPRRKARQGLMLDAIPEDEEMGKEQGSLSNVLVRQRKLQLGYLTEVEYGLCRLIDIPQLDRPSSAEMAKINPPDIATADLPHEAEVVEAGIRRIARNYN
ncbi:hypothetical protein SASPL_134874 [Salvia splendens]|uniref:Uncharacterized protein n=1 Tax=Salvia splendens TaxID=180675 RepID=A0A8X8ZEX8_SALSN|nr:hypothetical protein SASPL_134874 [Salvia splendens]